MKRHLCILVLSIICFRGGDQLLADMEPARSGEPLPASGMALIPAGTFHMTEVRTDEEQRAAPCCADLASHGSGVGEENTTETHPVYVGAFYMDRYPVTGELWNAVVNWALENGYDGIRAGEALEPDHPVHSVTWFSALKWLNARSEKEGLTPVYYLDGGHSVVYRTGQADLVPAMVKWDADGYRLPTEAEWEKAARGGLHDKLFPWGNEIDCDKANYHGCPHPWSQFMPRTTPVGWYNGQQSTAGPNMVNGYGLYDMAGNVWEWCWDRFGAEEVDPEDSTPGSSRVLRGGAWDNYVVNVTVSRRYSLEPDSTHSSIGLRCARAVKD